MRPAMNHDFIIQAIKKKFEEVRSPANVPKLKGETFKAELVDGGIQVDNLGNEPFLKWDVFREVFQLIRSHGGWVEKGNAMNSKLGEAGLSFESIEGHIAHTVYGKKEGDNVFRRITPIANILIWAGICENEPNGLKLTDIACEDERIIRLHWNYFLALEKDVEGLSRFIEFEETNFKTYSIQLAHLLLGISSEVDVVSKALCKEIDFYSEAGTIKDYRKEITNKYFGITQEQVHMPLYNLNFKPWEMWRKDINPAWWNAYNNIKHNRSQHYHEANLENVLNALAGLLVMILFLKNAQTDNKKSRSNDNPLEFLRPLPQLYRFDDSYYAFLSKDSF